MSTPEYRKDWIKRNPEKRREYERRRREKNPDYYRAKTRRAIHKMRGMPTPTRPRPELCEACSKPEVLVKKGTLCWLGLDHDHETGAFRGWLCSACNLGIGKLGDNIMGVKLALAYLERAATNGRPEPEIDRRLHLRSEADVQ